MDRILIRGGKPLAGSVRVRGAKNSTLPLMAATILAEEPCTLHNVPSLHDVFTMSQILVSMGMAVDYTGDSMTLDSGSMTSQLAPYDLVRKMRASFFVLGPLLGRFGEAKVSVPGGCAIGTRPVDIHVKALETLGAEMRMEEGYVAAEGVLRGADVTLDFPSVGATENVIMAASRATGTTHVSNAAREPEIVDLAAFLNKMGARISGAGSEMITIEGVEHLSGVEHDVIPDRIEAGTFLLAGLATRGDVTVQNCSAEHLGSFLEALKSTGAEMEVHDREIRATAPSNLQGIDIATSPYPGFPTDLQAQMMAVLCLADGTSIIKETVFENRFMQVAELLRMGANIEVKGNAARVHGVPSLTGAPVMASDLRASAALLIAALSAAEGETEVSRVYHIDRGYERIEKRLASLGADIERVQ